MARSDLLISLVKAGRYSPDPKFRATVEAIIAEERAKQHGPLADALTSAMANGLPPANNLPQLHPSTTVVGDLLYEFNPERSLRELVLPSLVERECTRLIEEQQRAELLRSYGIAPRHRILLVGPPGNGKTSVAHGLAHDLMVPLLVVRYEGLIGSYLGETAGRLRKIFDYARQRTCVLFLDEFDAIGKERGDEHETGEIKRVVSTLLLQMDQLPPHVVIVTATNHAELLDRAVWRRFELRLTLPKPSPSQIEVFLLGLMRRIEIWKNPKPTKLARQLQGATFSELEEFVRDVTRRAVLESPDPNIERIVKERLEVWQQRAGSTPRRQRSSR